MIFSTIDNTLPSDGTDTPYTAINLGPETMLGVLPGYGVLVPPGMPALGTNREGQWLVIHWEIGVMAQGDLLTAPLDALSLLLARECLMAGQRSPQEKDGACLVIASRLGYTWEETPTSAQSAETSLVDLATQYLAQRLDQTITLDVLCEAMGYSKVHVIQSFKRAGLHPPMRYLSDLRIARAKELLETTEDSVVMIANAVGYNSGSRFSQAFKQHTGHSPLAWRKRATWLL